MVQVQLHHQVDFGLGFKQLVKLNDIIMPDPFQDGDFALYHVLLSSTLAAVDNLNSEGGIGLAADGLLYLGESTST